MSDEQRVRTMAGWIGVEISRSRVRTPGKAGFGLYRVRAAAERHWHVPHPKVGPDGEWTAYAFTLEEIERGVGEAIRRGAPACPGLLTLPSKDPLAGQDGHRHFVTVPTRWTSAYTGKRNLGAGSLGEQQHEGEHCHEGGRPHLGPCVDPTGATGEELRATITRDGLDEPEPVRLRPEAVDQVKALHGLVDVGAVTMTHVEGCLCDDDRYSMACIRATMPGRMRQREANAAFQADHLERREHGLRARHAAKLSHNATRNNAGDPPSAPPVSS